MFHRVFTFIFSESASWFGSATFRVHPGWLSCMYAADRQCRWSAEQCPPNGVPSAFRTPSGRSQWNDLQSQFWHFQNFICPTLRHWRGYWFVGQGALGSNGISGRHAGQNAIVVQLSVLSARILSAEHKRNFSIAKSECQMASGN